MAKSADYVIDHVEKGCRGHSLPCDDRIVLEWYEVNKSRHSGVTSAGKTLLIVRDAPAALEEGDVLVSPDNTRIYVEIRACDCIVVYPRTLPEAGLIAFLIGNLHLPLFSDGKAEIYFAYDARIYDLLAKKGYSPAIEERKLLAANLIYNQIPISYK